MTPVIDLFPAARCANSGSRSDAPLLLADVLVAIPAAGSAAVARLGLEQLVGGVAPFILTFPAVMAATLLRGRRAGAIATLLCQMLTIRFVFPNWVSVHGGLAADYANVVLSTVALAGTVWATASYRDAAALLRSRCQHQVETLSLLMTEADHRTKNNYQLAAGLLAHQSVTACNPEIARELNTACFRLETMASAFQGLSVDVTSHQDVDLSAHVARIVSILRTAALPEDVQLHYRGDAVQVPIETAIIGGLIVNEWITNALKYAFEGSGRIVVDVAVTGGMVEIVVDDDGGLTAAGGAGGRGSDLVRAFADVLNATISTVHGNGTRCVLSFAPAR